ncbi:hypothetical protein A8C56_22920 [Niabella ginsenosidivorans]|uniref:DUF4238 domain-containing protein n=1 Tax=Niabella ginsenosidivorans TaxID=1176587 RepID=A0A1A9I8Q0_9BACT|nr:DUF4238 domain-containing protein [Niabella ginsenosidivorans]ANH83449.1 hypothetical protein A8C56_22920 [Niabella ginsenosidivorans]
MKQLSRKHHYIPEFYLNNFTNEDGKFYIYLPKENRFKKNGELFTPQTHFFELDGNNLIGADYVDDHLEKSYSDWDNKAAILFDKIKTSKEERFGLSEKDMPILQFFIAHLYWRSPMANEFAKDLLKREGLNATGMIVRNSITGEIIQNHKFENYISSNESSYKFVKHWLPYRLITNLLKNDTPLEIITFNNGIKPNLIGDNPIIFRNQSNVNVYEDDFILPITSNKFLIRMKREGRPEKSVIMMIDALLIQQAQQFVATTNVEYISILKNCHEFQTADLREKLFSQFLICE